MSGELIWLRDATTGGVDGTPEGADFDNPARVPEVNGVFMRWVRAPEGTYIPDESLTLPDHLEVNFGDGYESGTASPAGDIPRVNTPILVRQVAPATTGTLDGYMRRATITSLGTPVDCAPLDAPALTVSVFGYTATLTWGAVTHADAYKVERATNAGFTTGLTVLQAALDALTCDDVGAADTVYYYRVTAIGSGRYVDSDASTAVSELTALFYDGFSEALSASWGTTGSAVTADGKVQLTSTTTPSAVASLYETVSAAMHVDGAGYEFLFTPLDGVNTSRYLYSTNAGQHGVYVKFLNSGVVQAMTAQAGQSPYTQNTFVNIVAENPVTLAAHTQYRARIRFNFTAHTYTFSTSTDRAVWNRWKAAGAATYDIPMNAVSSAAGWLEFQTTTTGGGTPTTLYLDEYAASNAI